MNHIYFKYIKIIIPSVISVRRFNYVHEFATVVKPGLDRFVSFNSSFCLLICGEASNVFLATLSSAYKLSPVNMNHV